MALSEATVASFAHARCAGCPMCTRVASGLGPRTALASREERSPACHVQGGVTGRAARCRSSISCRRIGMPSICCKILRSGVANGARRLMPPSKPSRMSWRSSDAMPRLFRIARCCSGGSCLASALSGFEYNSMMRRRRSATASPASRSACCCRTTAGSSADGATSISSRSCQRA